MLLFSDYRGMPKEAKYLVYASVVPSLAYGMFYTDISYFLTVVQGIPPDLMGLILTVMGVSTVILSIPLGVAADRYGRKKTLIVGTIIASSTIAIFALTANPVILIFAAFFEGISEAAISASGSALLADLAGNEKRTSAFSFYGFASGVAFGVGGFIIPTVVVFQALGFTTQASHTLLYVTLAALSMASTLLLLKIRESKRTPKTGWSMGALLPKKSRGMLLKYVLTGAIIAFGAGLFGYLMPVWFNYRYGISDALSGPILGVSNMLIGVSTLAAPFLARKMGMVKAIVVTEAVSTVFLFATPLSPDYLSASVIFTVRSFLMNASGPLSSSLIMGIVSEDERGVASGINSALWRLPNSFSVSLGAWLLGMGFLALPFFLAGLLYAASIALFWYYFRSTRLPEETLTGG